MLCDKCKKNQANIQYSQIINGLKVNYNLCESCFNNISYNNSFFYNFFPNSKVIDNCNENYKCNVCGNTFEHFKNTGKMGCANCYNTFREKLTPIFNNIQEKNIHIGKVPKNLETYKPNINNIDLLKEKLNIAIKNENYEEAINLRDKIREIERGDI